MKPLCKLLRLPHGERLLLVRAVCLLVAIRLGLGLLPFRTVRRWLTKPVEGNAPRVGAPQGSIDRIVWAVVVASNYVPGTRTCLPRALAAQTLLTRHGYEACLRIGVVKGTAGEFKAHAWVENQGIIVIGDLDNLSHYSPLPSLDRATPGKEAAKANRFEEAVSFNVVVTRNVSFSTGVENHDR